MPRGRSTTQIPTPIDPAHTHSKIHKTQLLAHTETEEQETQLCVRAQQQEEEDTHTHTHKNKETTHTHTHTPQQSLCLLIPGINSGRRIPGIRDKDREFPESEREEFPESESECVGRGPAKKETPPKKRKKKEQKKRKKERVSENVFRPVLGERESVLVFSELGKWWCCCCCFGGGFRMMLAPCDLTSLWMTCPSSSLHPGRLLVMERDLREWVRVFLFRA